MNHFWDTMAKTYTKNTEKIFSDANKRVIEVTKNYCKSDMHVLDIGCGTGLIIKDIAPCVDTVTAIDTSAKMITEAQKNEATNITWKVCDIFHVEATEPFDMITSFNVLRYIENLEEVLHKIFDMLPQGGYFISVTDCVKKDKSAYILMQNIGMKLGLLPYMKSWKMAELKEQILSAGFEEVYDENVFPKFPNYLVIARKPKSL